MNMKWMYPPLLIILCVGGWAFGQATTHISIEELRRVRLPDVVLAKVEAVRPDAAKRSQDAPHVRVEGIIGGNIRFELLLPDTWNGRFVMGGGGGFVGTVQNAARDLVNRNYATVGTDTGHEAQPGYMARWAKDNVEAEGTLRSPPPTPNNSCPRRGKAQRV